VGGVQYIARGPQVFELSELASLIWQLSDGSRAEEEIVAAITAEYQVEPEVARDDLGQFLDEMVDSGFMELAAP
jgi:hypothetical protein